MGIGRAKKIIVIKYCNKTSTSKSCICIYSDTDNVPYLILVLLAYRPSQLKFQASIGIVLIVQASTAFRFAHDRLSANLAQRGRNRKNDGVFSTP